MLKESFSCDNWWLFDNKKDHEIELHICCILYCFYYKLQHCDKSMEKIF